MRLRWDGVNASVFHGKVLSGASFHVEKRIDFKMRLLVYHALHDQATECMRDILQERTNVQTLRSTVSSSSEQTQSL